MSAATRQAVRKVSGWPVLSEKRLGLAATIRVSMGLFATGVRGGERHELLPVAVGVSWPCAADRFSRVERPSGQRGQRGQGKRSR